MAVFEPFTGSHGELIVDRPSDVSTVSEGQPQRMPQLCSICTSPTRRAIDVTIVAGTPNRRVATQYGMTEAVVHRHRVAHGPAQMARARDATKLADADDLVVRARALQARALAILDTADAAGDHCTALSAIREARGALELYAQLTRAVREHVEVHQPSEPPRYVAEWGKGTPTCWPDGTPSSPEPPIAGGIVTAGGRRRPS
jgi:hypothetical protein